MSIYRGRSAKEFYLASVLYDSIEDRNTRAVISLIEEKGADADIVLPKTGISPFHFAIGSENDEFALQVTTLILQHGGNPNVRSDEGLTPLHISAAYGKEDLVRLLLNCGADPDLEDNFNKTAEDYASEEQNHDIVKLLKEYISNNALSFLNRCDNKDAYKLSIDKIMVNNGYAVGEYEFIKSEPESPETIDLKVLPETTATEYVANWCNTLETQFEGMHLATEYHNNSSASDNSISGRLNYNNVTYYRPYSSKPIDLTGTGIRNPIIYKEHPVKDFCVYNEKSRESGITSLPDSVIEDKSLELIDKFVKKTDTSSDYFTCTDSENVNVLDQNIFELSSSVSSRKSYDMNEALIMSSTESVRSFISVSEIYKYTDEGEGVVLSEKRLLPATKINANDAESVTVSSAVSSKLSSLPQSFNYETDVLWRELTHLGFEPGPITKSTKRVYLRKLYNLKRTPNECPAPATEPNKKVFSNELQKTLKDSKWTSDLTPYRILEEVISNQFSNPDPNRKWREGINKSSFTYLLLDPRITKNLPCRTEDVPEPEQWEVFLSSIFYVGKGKRSRPYQHLYEAVTLHGQGIYTSSSSKLQRILDIWQDNHGVICLHIYQNVVPVEAYTREAAMISALKVDNIENMKSGDFYGIAATWNAQQKRQLGVYLLYKALKIFLQEGERQLCPNHID